MAIQHAQQLLYHVRNLLIFHVGIKDFESDLAQNQPDRLKRQLRILEKPIAYLLTESLRFEFAFSSLKVTSHQSISPRL